MAKPITLLERLIEHALSLGAQSITVECKDSSECVFASINNTGIQVAAFPASGADARELRGNLTGAASKPKRTVSGGRVFIIQARVFDSFGADAYEIGVKPAPKADPSIAPSFTDKLGQYLAFIYHYKKIHLSSSLGVVAQWTHRQTPGKARSIRPLVQAEHLPRLE